MDILWFSAGSILLSGVVIFLLVFRRKKKLSKNDINRIRELWQRVRGQQDMHRQILDADAVISQALTRLGYRGSMGMQLRAAKKALPNEQALWNAHKLRNRIAHEPAMTVTQNERDNAMRAFEFAIRHWTA